METRKEKAAEKKRCGSHNCTQAVLCTYHDFAGMEEETIKNVGNAFAAGMGNMEGTCGALVGAGIILGLATQDKAKSVKGMRQIMDKFKQRNGATQCKLLKGVGTGKVLRECPLCVADASEFLEEILERKAYRSRNTLRTVLPSATLSVDGGIFATHVTLPTSSTKRCFLRAFTSRFL